MFKKSRLAVAFCLLFTLLPRESVQAENVVRYTVGITPWQKGLVQDDIDKLYLPMLKYIYDKTGVQCLIKPMASYDETISQIASGKIDIAYLSPEPYVRAKKENTGLELLVTGLSWNADKTEKIDSYRSHILIKKDRKDLSDLDSLKGKKFGFVTESSTSGYVVPMAHFRSIKLEPAKFFSEVSFLGSHSRLTDAIADGAIDGGATWDFNWKQAMGKNGDVFKSIWKSDAIPNDCLVAHPKVPAEFRTKLRELLVKIPPELLKGLPIVGYAHKDDAFYDSVRKLSAK